MLRRSRPTSRLSATASATGRVRRTSGTCRRSSAGRTSAALSVWRRCGWRPIRSPSSRSARGRSAGAPTAKKNSAWRKANLVSRTDAPAHPRGRWTMIGHHVCHGGYNKQDDGTGRFTSHGFAIGSLKARVRDWLDWMLPEVRTTCSAVPHLRVASVWPRRAAVVLTRAPLRRPCRAGVERGAQQPAPLPHGRAGRPRPRRAQPDHPARHAPPAADQARRACPEWRLRVAAAARPHRPWPGSGPGRHVPAERTAACCLSCRGRPRLE